MKERTFLSPPLFLSCDENDGDILSVRELSYFGGAVQIKEKTTKPSTPHKSYDHLH
jgi:hypothetical protein